MYRYGSRKSLEQILYRVISYKYHHSEYEIVSLQKKFLDAFLQAEVSQVIASNHKKPPEIYDKDLSV